MNTDALEKRVAAVIGGVLRQAVEDAGSAGIVVLDDGTPEAALCVRWSTQALGKDAVWAITPALDSVTEDLTEHVEAHRCAGRLEAVRRDALLAHPANKTALLLGGRLPPEPLLPLGDLYASDVARLAGGWAAPPFVAELAEAAGGVPALDEMLKMLLDQRYDPELLIRELGDPAPLVWNALRAGRFCRRRPGLVPKLGLRTIGIDLFL